jgi:hypothetical protein
VAAPAGQVAGQVAGQAAARAWAVPVLVLVEAALVEAAAGRRAAWRLPATAVAARRRERPQRAVVPGRAQG